jgi:hypothetical protein
VEHRLTIGLIVLLLPFFWLTGRRKKARLARFLDVERIYAFQRGTGIEVGHIFIC